MGKLKPVTWKEFVSRMKELGNQKSIVKYCANTIGKGKGIVAIYYYSSAGCNSKILRKRVENDDGVAKIPEYLFDYSHIPCSLLFIKGLSGL